MSEDVEDLYAELRAGGRWTEEFEARLLSALLAPKPDAAPQFRFTGRATGKDPEEHYDPEGHYAIRWDQAQRVSVLAATREEATRKAVAMLGTHPRFGVSGFGDSRDNTGWALTWDKIDEEIP